MDGFIRNAYYGGGTDVYKAYGQDLKYYDVNSLYPFAMKNPMPYELIKFHNNLNNFNLDNFFGYMKDELNGLLIREAYFLGPKKYGYWY